MSTLAFANLAQAATASDTVPAPVELDGARAAALAAAVPVFRDKQPDANLANFHVHVHPAQDGTFQVIFEPRQDNEAAPTLGGRTAHGRELNVWIKASDNSLDRIAFAR
ncbi:hypothetical protein LDO26_12515 [Luteimonas sp. BDR2-5]|uniref:hypothetical protein n=1 Tax=Proluteimonas luteida TaxID=2878685 RepID=UPI001E5848C2|nr:hypothetical protein [Luteimonas sp. BDR2-5]MCD9029023.1 hypothetical protein [Luteimonas sp. BDR2-5]